jgi:hypothetical protein
MTKTKTTRVPSGPSTARAAASPAIRPFHAEIDEEQIEDMRRRLRAVRWPTKETVDDRSQGPQLANMQELVRKARRS